MKRFASMAQKTMACTAAVMLAHPSGAASLEPDVRALPALVARETNALRRDEGRALVECDARLDETARDFARYLARTG
jgi:hypothetical protein